MGVAGGELLIPTIVLLFAVDIKTAGSLSLVVSLPTMLVAFARYSRDGSFTVLRRNRRFVPPWPPAPSPARSSAAAARRRPDRILVPLLALILLISAVKVWRH